MIFSKINILGIIIGHFKTLTYYEDTKISAGDILLFYIFPLILSGVIIFWEILINTEVATALMSALAIFAGLLFNLLLLAHGLIKSIEGTDQVSKDKKELLRQLYLNISYSIVITLVAFLPIIVNFLAKNYYLKCITSFFTYFLIINFSLTMLMVLKRVNVLLGKEFGD